MKTGLFEVMSATLLLLAPATGQGAEASFAYQGVLLNDKGQVLVNRNHSIVFRLYDKVTGGSNLWSCTRSVYLSETGQFSTDLSGNSDSGETLGKILADNVKKQLYIGLTVDSDGGEIAPRQKVYPVPKAFWAADAMAAQNNFVVNSNLTCSTIASLGKVTAASLYVGGTLNVGLLGILTYSSRVMLGALNVPSGGVSVTSPHTIRGNGTIPIGGIVAWNGSRSSIPDGWALCDGRMYNGRRTPNLTDRFVLGVGNGYAVNRLGGAATVALGAQHIPPHAHDFKFKGADLSLSWKNSSYFFDGSGHFPGNDITRTTEMAGGQGGIVVAHENRPPYYALCYIMRVK